MTETDIFEWAVSKSKITDAKDREMIAKLESILQSNKTHDTIEPKVSDLDKISDPKVVVYSRRGRKRLFTWDEYLAAGVGKIPATKVARKLKVSVATVYKAIRENEANVKIVYKDLPATDYQKYKDAGIGDHTDIEVASRMGISRERVRQVRKILGLPRPNRANKESWRPDVELIKQKFDEGLNITETAKALNMSHNEVTYRMQKAGIKPKFKGPKCRHTKDEVVEAFKSTNSIYEAATKLGMKHYSSIFRYIDRYGIRDMGLVKDGRAAK